MSIVLSKKNSKVGNVVSFSISANDTCPGKTPWCEKKCYAKKLERIYPTVKKSYATNLVEANKRTFSLNMINALKKIPKNTATIRIHVSGDFYSVKYINQWIKVINEYPNLQFYAYTKSWRVPSLLKALDKLHKLPNLVLIASTDIDTFNKQEIVPVGWREAYSGSIKPEKFVTCLVQAGKSDTCESCKVCFKPTLKSNIYFVPH